MRPRYDTCVRETKKTFTPRARAIGLTPRLLTCACDYKGLTYLLPCYRTPIDPRQVLEIADIDPLSISATRGTTAPATPG